MVSTIAGGDLRILVQVADAAGALMNIAGWPVTATYRQTGGGTQALSVVAVNSTEQHVVLAGATTATLGGTSGAVRVVITDSGTGAKYVQDIPVAILP